MPPNKRMQRDRRIGAFLEIRIAISGVPIFYVALPPAADARALARSAYRNPK
jgi:hypothetical protein